MSLWSRKGGHIHRFVASFLLSTTILVSGLFSAGYAKTQAPLPLPPDNQNITSGPVDYPGRNDPDFDVKIYTTADEDSVQVPPQVMTLWQNMQKMKKDSNGIIGPTLSRFAASEDIWFTYVESGQQDDGPPRNYLDKLPPNEAQMIRGCLDALQQTNDLGSGTINDNQSAPLAGWWYDRDGVVYMAKYEQGQQGRELITMAHELTHGIQNVNGSSGYNPRWPSIRDFQACTLSFESAASACEFLIAWEMAKDSLNIGPWNAALADDPMKCAQIVKTYNDAIARGMPHARALEQAGQNAFYYQFAQEWWLDAYNDQMLGNYIGFVQEHTIEEPSQNSHYDIKTMQETGYLSSQFNFTARADSLPSDLFGDWQEMRQAFDRADLYRYERMLGKKSILYKNKLTEMRQDNNPYLNIDMSLVYHTLEACNYSLQAIAVMDYYAGRFASPQNNLKLQPSLN